MSTGKGGSPPSPPDYSGLADTMNRNNWQGMQYETFANRPDIYTPFGSMTWQGPGWVDPVTGQSNNGRGAFGPGAWAAQIKLSPAEQAALDSQNRIKEGRSALAENMLWKAGLELAADYPTLGDWVPHLPGQGGGGTGGGGTGGGGTGGGGGTPPAGQYQGEESPYGMGSYWYQPGNSPSGVWDSGGGGGGGGGSSQYAPGADRQEPGAPADDIVTALHRMEKYGPQSLDAYESELLAQNGYEAKYPVALARARWEQYGPQSLDSYENGLIGGDGSGGGGGGGGGWTPPPEHIRDAQLRNAGYLPGQLDDYEKKIIEVYGLGNYKPAARAGSTPPAGGGGGGGGGGGSTTPPPAAKPSVRDRAENAIYTRASSRLDPAWEQKKSDLENALWNQGLRPGMEVYDRQMQNFERARTDAYQTAMNESIMGGGQEASREFAIEQAIYQAALARRLQAVNEMNAIMNGQQVSNPSMPGFAPAGNAPQSPDLLGAATAGYNAQLQGYNAQQANANNFWSGIMGLGGAGLMAFSDARLKDDIDRLPVEAIPGVPFASWTWKETGEPGFGVIAQDLLKVRPDLVSVDTESGYLMVNYGRLYVR